MREVSRKELEIKVLGTHSPEFLCIKYLKYYCSCQALFLYDLKFCFDCDFYLGVRCILNSSLLAKTLDPTGSAEAFLIGWTKGVKFKVVILT